MASNLSLKDFVVHDATMDGNCLFRSVADQVFGDQKKHAVVRDACIKYMKQHAKDIEPFLADNSDEDFTRASRRAMKDDMTVEEKVALYVKHLSSQAVWGGEAELYALSQKYVISLNVYNLETGAVTTYAPEGLNDPRRQTFVLFSLGVHYDSLRRKDSPNFKYEIWHGVGLKGVMRRIKRPNNSYPEMTAREAIDQVLSTMGENEDGVENWSSDEEAHILTANTAPAPRRSGAKRDRASPNEVADAERPAKLQKLLPVSKPKAQPAVSASKKQSLDIKAASNTIERPTKAARLSTTPSCLKKRARALEDAYENTRPIKIARISKVPTKRYDFFERMKASVPGRKIERKPRTASTVRAVTPPAKEVESPQDSGYEAKIPGSYVDSKNASPVQIEAVVEAVEPAKERTPSPVPESIPRKINFQQYFAKNKHKLNAERFANLAETPTPAAVSVPAPATTAKIIDKVEPAKPVSFIPVVEPVRAAPAVPSFNLDIEDLLRRVKAQQK